MPHKPLPTDDLTHILHHARPAFEALRHANLFITGGTGFFGHWLLESLLYANRALDLQLKATVLTRNAAAFRTNSPHINADPAITLLEGDIATFPFPTEPHTHVIHAATDSGGKQSAQSPEALATSILAGTQHLLDFATHTSHLKSHVSSHETNSHLRLLYTSTGAVYGRSTQLLHTPETYPIPTLPPDSYESAKLAAEDLCLTHPELNPVIARCFAFVGPHLPLDAHFAIGNFLGAAISGKPIHIKGDGTPRRSWLYMSDLAIWLWTLLTHGQPNRAYNVGSDDGMTIAEAAHLVQKTVILSEGAGLYPAPQSKDPDDATVAKTSATFLPRIQIDGTPNPAAPLNSYVPDITRARTELGLEVTIPLPEALRRTAAWHQDQ
jgi:dTDP-glucose 4,6-dehydratase